LKKRRLIVGITGASGALYGYNLLEVLQGMSSIETHLIISPTGKTIIEHEIGEQALAKVAAMADHFYEHNDLTAPIASGSYITDGMIIAPCSAKNLAAISHAFGDNLITRAADVVLKERRKMVVPFRETPLNLANIENMAKLTQMGGIIMPPVPAFYTAPRTIEDVVNQTVGKALDMFDIDHNVYRRWNGMT
jgi:polyprenyl P-hydroxybenzoate/phenylacrylic acid decarboxylase-like protein